MKTSRGASAILALCVAWCVFEVTARRVGAVAKKGGFVCPEQCMECCKSTHGAFIVKWTNKDQFRCLLKSGTELPPDMSCKEATERSSNPKQMRTECDYKEEDKASEPWNSLNTCSMTTRCCCSESDNWAETVEKPLGVSAEGRISYKSDKSQQQGKMETAQLARQSVHNDKAACMGTGKNGVEYQKAEEHNHQCKKTPTQKGCCLKTGKKTIHYKYRACTAMSGGRRHPTSRPCRKTCEYDACVEWEQKYLCSKDDGISPSCLLYNRVSSGQGICIGDKENPKGGLPDGGALSLADGRCPKGFSHKVTGGKCKCKGACFEIA